VKEISKYSRQILNFIKYVSNRGFFDVFISNLLIGIVGFGGQFLVAWLLTPEDLGRIKIFQSYIEIAALFAVFGFDTSIIKICSELKYKENLKYLFLKILGVVCTISIISYFLFLFLNNLNLFTSDSSLKQSFYLYSLVFVFIGINKILFGFLQSQKMFRIYSLLQIYSKVFAILLIVILSYYFYLDGFYLGMLIGFAFTTLILLRIIFVKLKNIQIIAVHGVFSYQWYLARNSFYSNFCGTLSVLIGVILLNYQVDDLKEIGFYSFALVIGMGLSMITQSVQKVIFPYLSEKSDNQIEFDLNVNKYSKLFICFSSITAILCCLIFPKLLDFIFSNKYTSSNIYIQLIVISWFFETIYAIKGISYTASGHVDINAKVSFLRLVLNTFLTYMFIQYYGVIGVPIALIITNLFTAVFFNLYKCNKESYA